MLGGLKCLSYGTPDLGPARVPSGRVIIFSPSLKVPRRRCSAKPPFVPLFGSECAAVYLFYLCERGATFPTAQPSPATRPSCWRGWGLRLGCGWGEVLVGFKGSVWLICGGIVVVRVDVAEMLLWLCVCMEGAKKKIPCVFPSSFIQTLLHTLFYYNYFPFSSIL